MCCFSVQKEIQRGVLTALPAAGSPVGMSSSKCLFFFYYFFFFLEEEKTANAKGETEMLVLAVIPSHWPLSEWFSNLFSCLGWDSVEDIGPSCVCLWKTNPPHNKTHKKTQRSGTLYRIFFPFALVLLVCSVFCCLLSWSALVAQFAHAICLAWLSTHLQLCLVVSFFYSPLASAQLTPRLRSSTQLQPDLLS